ncbi:hypothetical protein KA043_02210 [Candidatus Saccharibacteria bacterium]|nr:hypothetical protein [Candidatus Saccharibacteria bacterium]
MRKILFITVLLIAILTTVIFTVKYKNSFQVINLDLPAKSKIEFYEANKESTKESKVLYEFSESGKYKIKKGLYVYKAIPNDTKQNPVSSQIYVDPEPVNLQIKFYLKDDVLRNMLNGALPAIGNALVAKYPTQMQQFQLKYGKMYIDGTWFAGKLIPNDTGRYDNLQVVLHENNGAWEVVYHPAIIISKTNTDIPNEILDDLNITTRDSGL